MAFTRRRALLLGLVVALGAGVFSVAWRSDEAAVARKVERIAGDVSRTDGTGDEKTVFESFTEGAVVTIGDDPPLVGHQAIVGALTLARSGNPNAVVAVDSLTVQVDGARAHVSGLVAVSGSQHGDIHRDERSLSATLLEQGGSWRVSSLTVGRETHEAPEARP